MANLRAFAAFMRAAESILVSRSKVASQAGKTFGGDRDLYAVLGYNRTLTYSDFNERYRRGGIAGRIVDIPAAATWRNPPKVKDDSSQDETEFDLAWIELEHRLKIYHFMERADRLSGIGHYGAMLVGAPGALTEPLPPSLTVGDILFLSAFTEEDAQVATLEDSVTSPRFGQPKSYNLKVMSSIVSIDASTRRTQDRLVHHSRIIHIAEGLGQDEIYGMPRLLRIWNYLDDLDKVIGGSAEAIWRTVDRGIQFDLDKDAFLDPEDEKDFADEIEEYMHGLKRYLKTQGVTANVLGSETTNPQGAFGTIGSLIAGTTGIPMRVLFGSERGQLASTQDERNFNARMKERQLSFAEPMILRPFINLLIEHGALPAPSKGYSILWPDLSTLTKREQMDVAARAAQAIRNVAGQGSPSAPTIILPADVFRREFLGLDIEVDEEPVEEPEEEEEPPATPIRRVS